MTTRVDVQGSTMAALGVAAFATYKPLYKRFRRLPEEEFDIGHLDGLTQACFAVLYALAEARAAHALETDAGRVNPGRPRKGKKGAAAG
jgi:hypothetical protein